MLWQRGLASDACSGSPSTGVGGESQLRVLNASLDVLP